MESKLRVLFNLCSAILEQFVFLGVLIAGLICWATFGNAYIAVSVFILNCILFWVILGFIKRLKK
jgi:hypothetical protein